MQKGEKKTPPVRIELTTSRLTCQMLGYTTRLKFRADIRTVEPSDILMDGRRLGHGSGQFFQIQRREIKRLILTGTSYRRASLASISQANMGSLGHLLSLSLHTGEGDAHM